MFDPEKKNRAAAVPRLSLLLAAAAALPILSVGMAHAQGQPAAPVAPATAPAAAPERLVDINEYIVRGNTVLDQREIETAVTPFLGPQRAMKDIEGARDALLAAYQAKGYQSVYVDLPEQQVTQGTVFLRVNETRVGRVRVVGAEHYSPLEVRDEVPALKEGAVPNFNQAQTELTQLNRNPKRQVMPLVKQGAIPGTMDVDLKVEDEKPWRASVGLSNDYSPDTRKLRATTTLANDNLWQAGHSASITFFGAPQDLSQTKVWSASYMAPIPGSNWSVEASGYKSDSNVATVGGTTVLGKGHSFGFKATYTVPNTGNWYHSFSAGIDFKNLEQQLHLGDTGDTVPLKYAPVTLGYSGFTQSEDGQLGVDVSIVSGLGGLHFGSDWQVFDNNRFKAASSFMLLKSNVNGTLNFGNGSQLASRFSIQLTDSPLVSGEQMAIGGMSSVRGYLSAEATGDYGVIGSLEMRTPPITLLAPLVNNWRLFSFIDGGRVRLRAPLPEQDDRFSLMSFGLGTSFQVGESVSASLDVGYPLRDGPRTERHSPRVNFNLTANY